MMRKRNTNQDQITIENILKEMSSFEATYAELLVSSASKPIYDKLKGISEQQFFNAPESNYSDEEELQQIKMQFAEISKLAMSADNIIDSVISEKFQSNFLGKLKEEVLKIILKLDQESSSTEKSKSIQPVQPAVNLTEAKKTKDLRNAPDKFKDASKGVSENLDIGKQVSDVPPECAAEPLKNIESILSTIKREEDLELYDENNCDFGNLSFDSLSSVHTSDLSSFNDEISLSSEDGMGKKGKRISFKMAEEEVMKIRAKRLKSGSEDEEQTKEIKSESPESANDSSSAPQKPQRVRKPNSKYNEYDVLSPAKTKAAEKPAPNKSSTPAQTSKTLPQTNNSAPRRRGRPRKNP